MLDELMQHVPKKWYRFHWIVWVVINLGFLLLYIWSQHGAVPGFADKYGLNDAVLYMSVGILFYMFTVYWLVARTSTALAAFLASMMVVLQFINVFNETHQSPSSAGYVAVWLFICWMVGMHGLVILLGAALVSYIYLLMAIQFDFANIQPISIALAIGALAVVVIGYFFWRNRFITESSERVNKLSGMLKTNEKQSEILIKSITDGIIVVDTAGKISLINSAAAGLTGWPEQEATGVEAALVMKIKKDPKAGTIMSASEHPFSQVLKKREQIHGDMQLVNRKNDSLYISLSLSPVIVPGSNEFAGAVAVFRDVSKEKAEEEQRAEFISTASHEMRTPVAAIEGYLALALNDKVSKIDSNARGYLSKAHLSTQHLGQLFQDLLTSAKAEDGRLTSHPVVVEMSGFITQICEDLRFGAEKKGLKMELVVNSQANSSGVIDTSGGMKTIQPLYYCYIDPDRVREVITNVFDNAVKYTPEGQITLGLTGNDQVVQITVTDTGAGIPPEDLPHLFQKFYRVDNSATRAIGGTGLGLFICKKIVELYKGNIWAESKLGDGSIFYINFPRLSANKAEVLKNQVAGQNTLPQA